jgi:hypothetical protein
MNIPGYQVRAVLRGVACSSLVSRCVTAQSRVLLRKRREEAFKILVCNTVVALQGLHMSVILPHHTLHQLTTNTYKNTIKT